MPPINAKSALSMRLQLAWDTDKANRQMERQNRRNLNRSGGLIRSMAKREMKKDDPYDPRIDQVFYRNHGDMVEVTTIGEAAQQTGARVIYSKAIPIRRATNAERARYRGTTNINARWYWIRHKTTAQYLRGMENLSKIQRLEDKVAGKKRKKRKKHRTSEEIMDAALERGAKTLLSIWGKHPLTA